MDPIGRNLQGAPAPHWNPPFPARTEANYGELVSKRPQEALREFSACLLTAGAGELGGLDFKEFVSCLKTAPRGSAAGPGGMTYEHLRAVLGDEGLFSPAGGAHDGRLNRLY